METRGSAFALRSSAASGGSVFIIARDALFVKSELRCAPNCAKLRRPEGRRSKGARRPSGQRRRPRGQRRPDRRGAQARRAPTPRAEPREAHRGAEEADAPTTEQPRAEARTQTGEERTRAEPNNQAAATDAPSGRDPPRHRPTGNDNRGSATGTAAARTAEGRRNQREPQPNGRKAAAEDEDRNGNPNRTAKQNEHPQKAGSRRQERNPAAGATPTTPGSVNAPKPTAGRGGGATAPKPRTGKPPPGLRPGLQSKDTAAGGGRHRRRTAPVCVRWRHEPP